jgi:hypothetical protein
MDLPAILNGYIQIVGLLSNFMSSRGQKDTVDIKEFVEWLGTKGHGEIVELLNRNQGTTIAVKAALSEGFDKVLEHMAKLERLLAAGSPTEGPFDQIALAVHPKARLSQQQQDILTAFCQLHAGKAMLLATLKGSTLAFLDAQGGYEPIDPQFFEADLDELLDLKFLNTSRNSAGNKLFHLTRAGHEVGLKLVDAMPAG